MEKLKDFLYNKNDLLVALIILVIAAAVIFFRVEAIMAYPETLVKEQQQTVQEVQDDKESDDKTQDDKGTEDSESSGN